MTAPDSLDGTDPLLRGVGLDAQTRCAHYATARDVVALRFACCPAYWSCHRCHAELADHPAVPVPADDALLACVNSDGRLLVFAAGIFAGIFSGTKMVDALAQTLVDWIPPSWGHLFPVVVAITSMPLTFVLLLPQYQPIEHDANRPI